MTYLKTISQGLPGLCGFLCNLIWIRWFQQAFSFFYLCDKIYLQRDISKHFLNHVLKFLYSLSIMVKLILWIPDSLWRNFSFLSIRSFFLLFPFQAIKMLWATQDFLNYLSWYITIYHKLLLYLFSSIPQIIRFFYTFTLPEPPHRTNTLFHYYFLVITTYPHLMPKSQSLCNSYNWLPVQFRGYSQIHMVFCLFWLSSTGEVPHVPKWCSSNRFMLDLLLYQAKVFCEPIHLENAYKVKQSLYYNYYVITWYKAFWGRGFRCHIY